MQISYSLSDNLRHLDRIGEARDSALVVIEDVVDYEVLIGLDVKEAVVAAAVVV